MPVRALLLALLLLVAIATLPAAAIAAPADLDPTFAGDGTLVTANAAGFSPGRLAAHPDGGVVVTGAASDGTVVVLKLRADGQPDPAFGGGDGLVLADVGLGHAVPGAATVLPDGRLLVVGLYRVAVGDVRLMVMRMTATGEPDPELDADGDLNGSVVHDLPGSAREVLADTVLLPDGGFWALGTVQVGGVTQPMLARLLPDGGLDGTYDGDGYAVTPLPGFTEGALRRLTALPDGRMVAVGAAEDGAESRSVLVRYTAAGTPDPEFGAGGVALVDSGAGGDALTDLAVAPDGAFLAAGYGTDGAIATGTVVRITAGGALDAGFGSGGVARVAVPGATVTLLSGIAALPDGRALVTGMTPPPLRQLVVARLRRGGGLDPAFGTGGVTTIDLAEGDDEMGADVLAYPDGRALVLGQVTTAASDELALIGLQGSPPDTDEDGLPDAGDPCVAEAGPGGCPPPAPPAGPAGGGGGGPVDEGGAVSGGGPVASGGAAGSGVGGAGATGGGAHRAARDTLAPRVTRAKLTRARLTRRARRTTLRLQISEAATVKVSIVRRATGRRQRTVTRRATRAGTVRLPFSRGTLRPGAYRAVVVATDAAGNRSRRVTLRFRVAR